MNRRTLRFVTLALAWLAFTLAAVSRLRADDPRAENVQRMVVSATGQTRTTPLYDPAYVKLAYPGGDVPPDRGVCTDVVIRSLRGAGVDLQKLVHEDMAAHFGAYPHEWGLSRPDPNIDHRRVPNLAAFFKRQGKSLPVTTVAADYQPGDIVSWRLPGGLAHVGVVVGEVSPADPARHLMVHNIGSGARMEDVLFAYQITGHFRYFSAR